MNAWHKALFEENGYDLLGSITESLVDSGRLEQYDDDRVFDAVSATPGYFWDRFIAPALDRMADALDQGFIEVDANDSTCEHNNESTHEDGIRCDDCGEAMEEEPSTEGVTCPDCAGDVIEVHDNGFDFRCRECSATFKGPRT